MDHQTISAHIKAYLQERYADYKAQNFNNRLIITNRNELLAHINGLQPEQLDITLEVMREQGDITEDTGAMIVFQPDICVLRYGHERLKDYSTTADL